jgi:cytochrome c1
MRALLICAALVVAADGCGGGGGSSASGGTTATTSGTTTAAATTTAPATSGTLAKAELGKQANAICTRKNGDLDKVAKPADNATVKDLVAYFDQVNPRAQ